MICKQYQSVSVIVAVNTLLYVFFVQVVTNFKLRTEEETCCRIHLFNPFAVGEPVKLTIQVVLDMS
jgi:hypothetical protein